MVPGSYKRGSQMDFLRTIGDIHTMHDRFEDNELSVELCPVPKGHVHFHHSLTCTDHMTIPVVHRDVQSLSII